MSCSRAHALVPVGTPLTLPGMLPTPSSPSVFNSHDVQLSSGVLSVEKNLTYSPTGLVFCVAVVWFVRKKLHHTLVINGKMSFKTIEIGKRKWTHLYLNKSRRVFKCWDKLVGKVLEDLRGHWSMWLGHLYLLIGACWSYVSRSLRKMFLCCKTG